MLLALRFVNYPIHSELACHHTQIVVDLFHKTITPCKFNRLKVINYLFFLIFKSILTFINKNAKTHPQSLFCVLSSSLIRFAHLVLSAVEIVQAHRSKKGCLSVEV